MESDITHMKQKSGVHSLLSRIALPDLGCDFIDCSMCGHTEILCFVLRDLLLFV